MPEINTIQTYNHPHGQVLITEDILSDIADAIREKTLNNNLLKPSDFSKEIIGVNTYIGGEYEGEVDLSVEEKDVNFYDYDGTRVYSYTKDQFLELNALPANPSHIINNIEELVAQNWNWNLSDAQYYIERYDNLNIGQMYNAYGGAIEIDVIFPENYTNPTISFNIISADVGNTQPIQIWDEEYNTVYSNTQRTSSQVFSQTINNILEANKKYTIYIENSYFGGSYITITGTSSGSNLLTGGGTNDDIYRNCITDIRVGSCVSQLGNYAFKNCNSLRTITLHKDLTSIGENAFQNCYSLKSITIPNTITSIDSYAFQHCYSLKSITISNTVTLIGNYVFLECQSLKSITIPNTVTLIGNSVFSGCSSLKSIVIPNTVTSIKNDVFTFCYSLKSIVISNTVTSIEQNAFSNCFSLKLIIIPYTVTSIDTHAFSNCRSITSYHLKPTTPPTLGTNVFRNILTDTKIYVPWSRDHSVYQAYLAASGWSDLSDHIVEEDQMTAQAYAEFDSNSGSLTFFRDQPNKYTNNQIDGTKIYFTGIENTGSFQSPGWISNRANNIQHVIFENQIRPTSCYQWFYDCCNSNFTQIINLNKLNTQNVTDMTSMFYNCQNFTTLDLSSFDTSKVISMAAMFDSCVNLTSLNIGSFNTSRVQNMSFMFRNCSSLEELNLFNFNTSFVTNMNYMFRECENLQTIYISNLWKLLNVINSSAMFTNCISLIGGNGTEYNSSYVDKTYARIDNPPDEPGYLTDIADKPTN